jgi:hypothetical protein
MQEQEFKLQNELTLLSQTLTALQIDAQKFDEGNGAAGKRARKHLASLRANMQSLRFKIQEVKNQRKEQKKTQTV